MMPPRAPTPNREMPLTAGRASDGIDDRSRLASCLPRTASTICETP